MPISMQTRHIPWTELEPYVLANWGWPDGHWMPEHLAVLGPSGSGKSYFVTGLIDARVKRSGAHAVYVATKPADATVTRLHNKGWPILRTWPPDYGEDHVIFWPPSGRPGEGMGKQRKAIFNLMDELWKPDSNTIIVFDEIAYLEDELKLKPLTTKYWREGRALGITMVAGTQRPRFVSRYMHSETSWCVAFRFRDLDDARRVAEIMGSKDYLDVIMSLGRHEFLLVRKQTDESYISRLT